MKKRLISVILWLFLVTGFAQATTFSHEYLYRVQPNRCTWFDRGTHFVISKDCTTAELLPELSLQEAVEAVRPYIVDVQNVYSVDEQEFFYSDAWVVYDDEFLNMVSYWSDAGTWEQESNNEWWVTLPKSVIAYGQMEEWSSFASVRDTSTYWYCRKTNYDVAMAQIDWVEISPGQLLNMNKVIARQPWYCTWGQNFLFYQGACWWSTQLFWNGMLNPFLEVTKRYAHGMWYQGFYGSKVMWDDASMYEWWKQLEVKNIGDLPIYMMTYIADDWNTVLLSFYPWKHDMKTFIQKQQTGVKSAVVSSTVFDKHESIVYSQEWVSNYRGIDTSVDETAPSQQ